MINGIEVIHSNVINYVTTSFFPLFAFGFVLFVLCVLLCSAIITPLTKNIKLVLGIVGLGLLLGCLMSPLQDSVEAFKTYDVIISDDVDLQEFNSNYVIISSNDDGTYTITEKENKNKVK